MRAIAVPVCLFFLLGIDWDSFLMIASNMCACSGHYPWQLHVRSMSSGQKTRRRQNCRRNKRRTEPDRNVNGNGNGVAWDGRARGWGETTYVDKAEIEHDIRHLGPVPQKFDFFIYIFLFRCCFPLFLSFLNFKQSSSRMDTCQSNEINTSSSQYSLCLSLSISPSLHVGKSAISLGRFGGG